MSDFTDGRFIAVGGTLRKAPFHKTGEDGKTTISMGFEVAKLSEWVDEDFCDEMAACLNAHDELVAALKATGAAISGATFPPNHPIWAAAKLARNALSKASA